MVNFAAVVNLPHQMLVYAKARDFSQVGLENNFYSAVDEAFNCARKSDVRGGVIFTDVVPNLHESNAILSAKMTKVISQSPVNGVTDIVTVQLLEGLNIAVIYCPEIILEPEED